ncbi:MAG: penicillin-insensitive murein endopeptidase [Betaproteobacteria bacterium]
MRGNQWVAARRCRAAALVRLLLAAARPALADDAAPVPAASLVSSRVEPSASSRVEPSVAELAPDPIQADPGPADAESLLTLAERSPADLGPLSIGSPDAGLLVNPLPFPAGPYWKVRNPLESYGTAETIESLVTAIEAVEARFPGSPRVVIGDISRPDGGRLNRHRSHQAGRDADVGFYYAAGEAGDFAAARKRDLDLPRTWALVRALITETDVDRIFVDRSLIAVLYAYARDEEREDVGWLDDVFGRLGDGRKGIIQHERRHKNHMHVRFFNRQAQEHGRIVYPELVREGVVPPPLIKHRVRRGETLGHLAARYGTSVAAIRVANGLRSTRLRAGRSYLIPIRRVPAESAPVVVPPRRLPPSMAHVADAPPEAEPAADGIGAAH